LRFDTIFEKNKTKMSADNTLTDNESTLKSLIESASASMSVEEFRKRLEKHTIPEEPTIPKIVTKPKKPQSEDKSSGKPEAISAETDKKTSSSSSSSSSSKKDKEVDKTKLNETFVAERAKYLSKHTLVQVAPFHELVISYQEADSKGELKPNIFPAKWQVPHNAEWRLVIYTTVKHEVSTFVISDVSFMRLLHPKVAPSDYDMTLLPFTRWSVKNEAAQFIGVSLHELLEMISPPRSGNQIAGKAYKATFPRALSETIQHFFDICRQSREEIQSGWTYSQAKEAHEKSLKEKTETKKKKETKPAAPESAPSEPKKTEDKPKKTDAPGPRTEEKKKKRKTIQSDDENNDEGAAGKDEPEKKAVEEDPPSANNSQPQYGDEDIQPESPKSKKHKGSNGTVTAEPSPSVTTAPSSSSSSSSSNSSSISFDDDIPIVTAAADYD
jgi:hypothetical protein